MKRVGSYETEFNTEVLLFENKRGFLYIEEREQFNTRTSGKHRVSKEEFEKELKNCTTIY